MEPTGGASPSPGQETEPLLGSPRTRPPEPLYQELLVRGWNSFGSCVILASYFSSIPVLQEGHAAPDPIRTVTFGAGGVGILLVIHGVWFLILPLIEKAPGFSIVSDAVRVWHGASLAVADMGYLLILCQPLIGDRGGSSHIPSEHVYTPILFACCFVAPRILRAPGGGWTGVAGERGPSWVLFSGAVAALNLACFFTAAGMSTEGVGLRSKLEDVWAWFVFSVLCVVYAIPLPTHEDAAPPDARGATPTDTQTPSGAEHREWKWRRPTLIGSLLLIKSAALVAGVALFHHGASGASVKASCTAHQCLHDFYPLRALAHGTGRDVTSPSYLSAMPLGTLLRASALLSACLLSAHISAAVRERCAAPVPPPGDAPGGKSSRAPPEPERVHGATDPTRRLVEINEIRVGCILLCIVLAAFSVEPAHDYHSRNPHSGSALDRHSTGFLLSQGVLLSVLASASVLLGIRVA